MITRRQAWAAIGAALAVAALAVGLGLAAADAPEPAYRIAGASADRGRDAVAAYTCNACHMIPGVRGFDAKVGPPLEAFATRSYIAGRLPNDPESLVRWIMDPQGVVPGNDMPNLGIPEGTARDIAQFLYTLTG
ncbi:MAG: c-type cytochrome [Solirubrobacteraceae bacterium]